MLNTPRVRLGGWVLALTLTACWPAPSATPTVTAPPPTVTSTLAPTAATAAARVTPVLDRDFPDPDVLAANGVYYAYATNSGNVNIQVARSTDLQTWEVLGDALPHLPAWAVPDFGWAWAPDVSLGADGATYLMYFTARDAIGAGGGGTQCIGVATSAAPEEPFAPAGDGPRVCPFDQGGAIDPATFTDDDGTRYLLWKNDGNSAGGRTYLYLQPLAPDGLSLTGEPAQLLGVDQGWEGQLIEAPTLWQEAGRYYLFYSANDYATPRYAVGVAVADNVRGPYTKLAGPLLATTLPAGLVGPGGQDVIAGPDGQTWLAFHTWTPDGFRSLSVLPLGWAAGWPVVELPQNP